MANSTNLDTKQLFNEDEFADVLVRFGTILQHKKKCHRIILSAKSTYLKAILKDPSEHREDGFPVILLPDDDSTVINAILRSIYLFEYVENGEQRRSWRFHLDVAALAHK